MDVLHIITTLDRGGAENHLLQLVEGQIQAGCSVVVMYLKGSGELAPSFESVGATVEKAPIIPLAKRLASQGFDVVHAHLPRAELYACIAARKSRLVVSRHLAGPYWPGAPTIMSRAASRVAGRRARQVICISQAVRDYMITSGHCRDDAKLKTVYYGYSPKTRSQKCSDGYDQTTDDPIRVELSCIARLVPQKDLPTLIKAVHELGRRGIDAHVRIAGSGSDLASLQQLSVQLRVDQRCEFVGRISQAEEFIAKSDIFVLPSLFEGFGLVLLEAAASGVPAIAARNTAMAEVIVDRETGLLFNTSDADDLANKIEELARSSSLKRTLADGAINRLRSVFSVSRMVDETSKVYRSLDDNHPREVIL